MSLIVLVFWCACAGAVLTGWLLSVGVCEGENPDGTSMNVFLSATQTSAGRELIIPSSKTWPQASQAKAGRPGKNTKQTRMHSS
jgi:hypothetical protein